ncbi:MAG: CaiB/BaiF CoA transferase family protein [Acidimicrobiales bacterium]
MTDLGPPLAGLKVLDFGRIYQGPYCGLLLALAGADVIKIEAPEGEPVRARDKRGQSEVFAMLNSNKRSLALDLKSPAAVEVVLDLVAEADVVIENFAPGVMDRLGLGADVLLERNPRLVYGSGTGFGLSGPDRDRAAMDLTIQARMGVMDVTGYPDQPPVKTGPAFIDFLGGTHLYGGVVTALFQRERVGKGQVVESSMADATFHTLASSLSGYWRNGEALRMGNTHAAGQIVPYDVYPAADGWIAMLIITDAMWRRLCNAMGQPELGTDPRYATNKGRHSRRDEVNELVAAWTGSLAKDDIFEAAQVHHFPAAPIRSVAEVVDDPHMHERGSIQWIDHPHLGRIVLPGSPLLYHGSNRVPLVPSPQLGTDRDDALQDWLGLSSEAIEGLAELGAFG